MNKLQEFIEYLNEQEKNHSIYVWGAQGENCPTVCEKWITAKEAGINRMNALKTFRAAVAAGFKKQLRAFDCSGLGIYFLYNQKSIFKSDMTANGMKGKCTLIQRNHLKKGDWVFRTYTSGSQKGRAYHIGYVVDDNINIVEARGRAYGVQKRSLNASGVGYWNTFGRPAIFANIIDTSDEQQEHMSFNRLLKKGCSGDDVFELQKLLNAAGDDIKVDGDFGIKTRGAVVAVQKKCKLRVDGIAGKQTITALGGIWIGK